MICAEQITKEEALRELERPMYDAMELEQEIDFVSKKLQFSRKEFEDIIKAPPKKHSEYKMSWLFRSKDSPIYQLARIFATDRNKLEPQGDHLNA